jgi:accessory gene regulator B
MKMGGSSSPLIYRSLRFRDKKSPFRYIIVEIVAQLVYSFFQESSFNEDCRNERFCNAINAKVGLLDESYSEWFAYSIEKRVTTLFTWLVQCLIGGFCFGWTLTISFSVFFLLIRKYTNGYHAATYSKCLFCSILLEVVLLASISYVFRTGLALLFLTIVSDITILYIAPVNNKNIHWSTNEFKAAKIAVRWLLLILNIFAILLVGTQIAPSILQGLVAALTADAITLSISRCQN